MPIHEQISRHILAVRLLVGGAQAARARECAVRLTRWTRREAASRSAGPILALRTLSDWDELTLIRHRPYAAFGSPGTAPEDARIVLAAGDLLRCLRHGEIERLP